MKPRTLQRSITWQRIHFLILSPAAPRCPCFGDSEVQIDLVISWNEEVVFYGNTVQVIFTGIWKIEMWSHCNIQGSEKLLSSCWAAISVPRGLWLFSSQNLWAQRDIGIKLRCRISHDFAKWWYKSKEHRAHCWVFICSYDIIEEDWVVHCSHHLNT